MFHFVRPKTWGKDFEKSKKSIMSNIQWFIAEKIQYKNYSCIIFMIFMFDLSFLCLIMKHENNIYYKLQCFCLMNAYNKVGCPENDQAATTSYICMIK